MVTQSRSVFKHARLTHFVACFGDCGLPAVLGVIAICATTDHEGSAGGLRGDYCFITDFHASAARWSSYGCGALMHEERNDFLEK